jgi:PST family polysaccharide transporter
MIYSSAGSIFQAINRTDLLFYYGVIGAIVLISGICYGVFWQESLVGVGYGLIFAFSLNFIIVFYLLIHVALKKSFFNFLRIIIFPLIICFAMVLVLLLLSKIEFDNLFFSLGTKVVISGLVFSALFFSRRENILLMRDCLREYIKSE